MAGKKIYISMCFSTYYKSAFVSCYIKISPNIHPHLNLTSLFTTNKRYFILHTKMCIPNIIHHMAVRLQRLQISSISKLNMIPMSLHIINDRYVHITFAYINVVYIHFISCTCILYNLSLMYLLYYIREKRVH